MKRYALLLVDDDPEDALIFRRRCPPGVQASHITDPAHCLQRLSSEPFDIAFIDYRLGASTGLDLIRQLRAAGVRQPLVLITGADLEPLGENALLAGATDFVPKDSLDAASIQRVIRWALIRRHVERQGEDETLDAAALALALAPPPAGPVANAPLRRVVLLGQLAAAASHHALLAQASQLAARHARTHCTGWHWRLGNAELQVLEGEAIAIGQALEAARHAPQRQGALAVLADETPVAPLFERWLMSHSHAQARFELSPSRLEQAQALLARELPAGTGAAGREALLATLLQLPALLRA